MQVICYISTSFINIQTRLGTYVRFEVFKAVTLKNAVFWDVTPYGSWKNRCFGKSMASIISVERISQLKTLAVTSTEILVTLMMEAIRISETLGVTRTTRRNIPGDSILHVYKTLTPIPQCRYH
jgi:hypothetical protein